MKANKTITFTNCETESLKAIFREIRQYSIPSDEEALELAMRAQRGDKKAADELALRNQRLIITIAKDYEFASSLLLEDLIQEGYIGLGKAIMKFDTTQGVPFCKYAVWYIRKSILDATQKVGQTIYIPRNVGESADAYEAEMRERIEDEELRQAVNDAFRGVRVVSLQDPMGNDDDSNSIEDCTASDDRSTDADDALNREIRNSLMRQLIESTLNQQEAVVVKERYGIDCEEMSVFEMAARHSVTETRIRQILHRAEEKLRDSDAAKNLAAA